jgi:hypothetical protein
VTIWRCSDPPGKHPEMVQVSLTLPETSFDDPVWIDLLTGEVYGMAAALHLPQETGTVLPRLSVYDSPIVVADRSVIARILEPLAEQPSRSASD